MSIFAEPKIDCHVHVLDPARFPYGSDVPYRPAGAEIGTAEQLGHLMRAHGVKHALLVQPDSGYGPDNRCMLDAIASGEGLFKGIAIVGLDASLAELRALKAEGVVGVAFNVAFWGLSRYAGAEALLGRLADLDMLLNLQVAGDQIEALAPLIETSGGRVLIDHCGRPALAEGIEGPAFSSLLRLAGTGRVFIKLSGYSKISQQAFPHEDMWPFVRALVREFGLERCVWASDWPFLRSPERQDYGTILSLVETLFPNRMERSQVLWTTPASLLGLGASSRDGA